MYVVTGATGHVGHALATELLDAGLDVVALTRKADRAGDLAKRGARIVEVDVHDVDALRNALRTGRRAFCSTRPPTSPATPTRRSARR